MTLELESPDLLLTMVDEAVRQVNQPVTGAESEGRRRGVAYGFNEDPPEAVSLPGQAEGPPSPLQGLVTLLTEVKRSGQFPGLEAATQGLNTLCTRLEERLHFLVVARSGGETVPTAITWLTWGGSTVTVLRPGSPPGAFASHLEPLSEAQTEALAQLRLLCEVLSVAGRLAAGLMLGGSLTAALPGTLAALAFAWLARQQRESRSRLAPPFPAPVTQ